MATSAAAARGCADPGMDDGKSIQAVNAAMSMMGARLVSSIERLVTVTKPAPANQSVDAGDGHSHACHHPVYELNTAVANNPRQHQLQPDKPALGFTCIKKSNVHAVFPAVGHRELHRNTLAYHYKPSSLESSPRAESSELIGVIAHRCISQQHIKDLRLTGCTPVEMDFLSIASNLTNETQNIGSDYIDSSKLMRSVEVFSEFFQPPEKEFGVSFPNIELKGKEFDAHTSGNYVQTFNEHLNETYYAKAEIDTNSLKDNLKNNSFKISSILYANIDIILPKKQSNKIQEGYFINSRVQSTTLKIANSKDKMNFKIPIKMSFAPKEQTGDLKTAKCVFWDYTLFDKEGGWSTEGCNSSADKNVIICECDHLTPFSVLMVQSERLIPFLDEITYIGLSISIGSLILFITIEIAVWNTVVKSSVTHFRHTTLINIAIALLFAQFFFLIGSIHSVQSNNTLCTIATIFTHFFFLSVFFWTLAQSLTLLYRLTFVFHHVRKSVFMSFSFFVGYICPLVIVIAATTSFISKEKYKQKSICWLKGKPSGEFTALKTFIVPIGCIIGINMFILTAVIVKLMRPSVSEGRNKEDKETIKKIVKAILILTPTFGLTWIIGFSLRENSQDFEHYAFVLLNSIQGLFILITSSFTETKVKTFELHFANLSTFASFVQN
ncbi:adhesion G-protein coupled receptor F1-like [Cetorhinus maximus]